MADENIQQDTPLLFTRKQVADQLGVSEKTISRLIEKGALQQIRIGRSVRIESQAVYHFLEEQRQYNRQCVESALSHTGESLCDSISETVSTKLPTNQQVENKLDALLKPLKRE